MILLLISFLCVTPIVVAVDDKSILTGDGSKIDGMKLQHIHVLFRHGDRTPITDAVNSPDRAKTLWPAGPGQLTEKGIVQEYQLGRWLRSKYGSFIPPAFNASDFHMRSTDIDRTLMSAQSVAAGVYENASSPLSEYGLLWRPIPVHTVSQEADVLLSIAPCPCLDLLRKLQMNSEEGISFENRNRELFNLLSDKLKRKIDRFNLWEVSDTLICMRAHNVSLPDWCSDKIYQEIIDADTFYWNLSKASTDAILRLEIGVFLHEFIKHANFTLGLTPEQASLAAPPHAMIYSAHDTDVVYLLAALGLFDHKLVPYAACVVLEIHAPIEPSPASPTTWADYRLRLLYKRGWQDPQGEFLQFPACANQSARLGCEMDKVFAQLARLVTTPQEFTSACNLCITDSLVFASFALLSATYIILIVLVTLLFVLFIIVGIVLLYRRKRHPADPERTAIIFMDSTA